MQKEYFQKLLEPLGKFKRKFGDIDSYVFEPNPTSNLCIVCKQGNYLIIEKKQNHKEQSYWRIKCKACKNFWQNKPL